MKQLFKMFKAFDFLLLFLILAFIITQTFFEMEFIGYTEKILSLVLTTNETKKFWSVGLQMIGIVFIILICIIIVNIFPIL